MYNKYINMFSHWLLGKEVEEIVQGKKEIICSCLFKHCQDMMIWNPEKIYKVEV